MFWIVHVVCVGGWCQNGPAASACGGCRQREGGAAQPAGGGEEVEYYWITYEDLIILKTPWYQVKFYGFMTFTNIKILHIDGFRANRHNIHWYWCHRGIYTFTFQKMLRIRVYLLLLLTLPCNKKNLATNVRVKHKMEIQAEIHLKKLSQTGRWRTCNFGWRKLALPKEIWRYFKIFDFCSKYHRWFLAEFREHKLQSCRFECCGKADGIFFTFWNVFMSVIHILFI